MYRLALIALIAFLAGIIPVPSSADAPLPSPEGKLFGAAAPGNAADIYEKTTASVVVLQLDWQQAQPKDPGEAAAAFDFATLDGNPLAKSAKLKILRIGLRNEWADKLRQTNPQRYWKLLDQFVTAAAMHAGERGVKLFSLAADEPDATGRPDWAAVYVEEIKHAYPAIKKAVSDSVVIAGGLSNGSDETVQALYDAGAKGFFDVLDIHAYSLQKYEGVDVFEVIAAHNAMARNGDGNKQIFVGAGWGRRTWKDDWATTVLDYMTNGYQNLLTERDIYDPAWVYGAVFNVFDDKVAANFLPKIPPHRFEATLSTAGPAFTYVVGKPYKLELKITNLTGDEMELLSFRVRSRGITSVKADPAGEMPKAAAPGNSAAATFDVTLPEIAANRQITLIGELSYNSKGAHYQTDCWLTLMPTPELEMTMLPSRAILDGRGESSRIGLSVINHSDTPFAGKITLTPSPRLAVKPSSLDIKIDSFGLEATVFTVTPEAKAAPGHYTVWVDVGGRAKDWAAVDIPVFLKKTSGKPDTWADGSQVTIARFVGENDGQGAYDTVGRARFAYDVKNLYIAIEVDDDKHLQSSTGSGIITQDSVQVAIDPLLDGSRISTGGYKPDDWEFAFAGSDNGPSVAVLQAASEKQAEMPSKPELRFSREGGKSIYRVTVPWTLLGISPTKGRAFAVGIAVNDYDGDRVRTTEWGGGISAKKDPRLFVPIVVE